MSRSDQNAIQAYCGSARRRAAILAGVAVLVVISLSCDVLSGPARLPLAKVFGVLLHPDSAEPSERIIVWTFRMPTALLALAVGAALGVAGAEMQTVLNNPLASPYTLGISAAASFGAALALVFGPGLWLTATEILIPGSAFVFSIFCALLIFGVSQLRGGSTETLVVGGVALHFLFSSGVAFLQYMASEDALQAIVFWMFGTLQRATWSQLSIICTALLGAGLFLASRTWQLTALRLGDAHARSLGIPVIRLRLQTLMVVSLLTATAVCFTGAIGFIGLVAPHVARMTVGEDQRFLMPLSALYGALFVSAAAVISKSLVPGTVFPIGIATAALGAPFFAGIALRSRRTYW